MSGISYTEREWRLMLALREALDGWRARDAHDHAETYDRLYFRTLPLDVVDPPDEIVEEARVPELERALGCALEELERRHPLGADPLTSAIIRDGRAVLAGNLRQEANS